MSVKYYFKIKTNMISKIEEECRKSELMSERLFNVVCDLSSALHIPIVRLSLGRHPLFFNTSFYESFDELMSFYKKNKKEVMVVAEDDYDKDLGMEALLNTIESSVKSSEPERRQLHTLEYRDNKGFIFIRNQDI